MEKYIEALAVIDAINKQRNETPNAPCGWLCDMLNARVATMRHADVVPVVRCKDCKYAHMTYGGECKYCDKVKEMTDGEYGEALYLPGDWFCAYGERREDG